WIHAKGIDQATKKHWWWVRKGAGRFIWPGHFFCTMLIALLLALFHRGGGRGAALVLLSGIFSGANSILKWIAGRNRPNADLGTASMEFHPCAGGAHGLIFQKN